MSWIDTDFTFNGPNIAPAGIPFDVQITKADPAVQFNATETNGLYYEDREVAGTLYRVQNATWSVVTGLWSLVNSTLPAYGFALTPSGTFEFVSQPASTAPWSAWGVGWRIDKNGSSSFPQVGTVTGVYADGRTTPINFVFPFAASCSGVVVTVNNGLGSGAYAISAQVDHLTSTGFNVYVTGGAPGSTVSITYMATGV